MASEWGLFVFDGKKKVECVSVRCGEHAPEAWEKAMLEDDGFLEHNG